MDTNVAGLNKVYCFTTNAGYNGKVVTITDGVNTWEKTIDSLSCVFMIPSMPAPAKKSYTVELHDGDATANALYSRVIDLGFGDSVRIGLYTTDENADKGYVQSWVSSHAYSLPTASSGTKGGITVSDTTSNGLYMSGTGLNLRTASSSQKGGVIVPNGTSDGLYVSSSQLKLRDASATQKGGIYVGDGLYISNGVLSAKTAIGTGTVKLDSSSSSITIAANSTRELALKSETSHDDYFERLNKGLVVFAHASSYINNLAFATTYFDTAGSYGYLYVEAINPTNSSITISNSNNFGLSYKYLSS